MMKLSSILGIFASPESTNYWSDRFGRQMGVIMGSVYTIDELKDLLSPIFRKYGLIRASVFGSYARGTAIESSDINLLIFLHDEFDLDCYIRFKDEVVCAVGKPIDILEYRSINKKLEPDILKEAVLLYEK